jgi:hypothetical protein
MQSHYVEIIKEQSLMLLTQFRGSEQSILIFTSIIFTRKSAMERSLCAL